MDSVLFRGLENAIQPIGPFTDYDEHEANIKQWTASLSEINVIELIDWIASPSIPDDGFMRPRHYIDAMRLRAALSAGEAAKRHNSDNIRKRFVDLLKEPSDRHLALLGIDCFADNTWLPTLSQYENDTDADVVYDIAYILGDLGTPEAIAQLTEMISKRGNEPGIGKHIKGAFLEWQARVDGKIG